MIAEASGPARQWALAERELTLQAAPPPALRPIAKHWRSLVAGAAGRHTEDPLTMLRVIFAADSICSKALASFRPRSESTSSACPTSREQRHMSMPVDFR